MRVFLRRDVQYGAQGSLTPSLDVREMQDPRPKLINPSLLGEYEIKNDYKNL
jgi:hypothetical protein